MTTRRVKAIEKRPDLKLIKVEPRKSRPKKKSLLDTLRTLDGGALKEWAEARVNNAMRS